MLDSSLFFVVFLQNKDEKEWFYVQSYDIMNPIGVCPTPKDYLYKEEYFYANANGFSLVW